MWRLAALAVIFVGCNLGSGVDLDGGAVEAEAEVGDEQPFDANDGQSGPVAGPMTFLIDALALVADRVCDVDGDGVLDNPLAELGPSQGAVAAAAFTSIGETELLEETLALHFPWVEDLAEPDNPEMAMALLAVSSSEEGSVVARPISLDECLEPVHSGSASMHAGWLSGIASGLPFWLGGQPVIFESVHVEGRVDPSGEAVDAHLCGLVLVQGLGALTTPVDDLSFLELFTAGGAVAGIPGVSGLSPDVDVDGDGLERFLVGDDGRLLSCIDGDSTVIEGRDCWRDERIADGISVTLRALASAVRFVGMPSPWERAVGGACPGGRPRESAWGGCAAEGCERWSSLPCEPSCGGDGLQRCDWDCQAFGPCLPRGELALQPDSCADLALQGGATCSGSPPEAKLVDGTHQRRAVSLREPVLLGQDAIVVEARARVESGASDVPCCCWGIVAYVDREEVDIGGSGWNGGLNWDLRGYAAQWAMSTTSALDDLDRLLLRSVDGSGVAEGTRVLGATRSGLPTSLDATTEGPVEEAIRLVLVPDLEETVTNERAVFAQFLTNEGEWSTAIACDGEDCPVPLVPGQRLAIGVTAGTQAEDSRVEIVSFRVENHGLCP